LRVLERVAHASLGRKIDHDLEAAVGNIALHEGETGSAARSASRAAFSDTS